MSDKKKPMFGRVTAIVAGMMALLGYSKDSEIPINAEEKKLDFTADQISKLKAHFGDDYFAQMQEAVDGEIKAYLNKNMDLKAIQDELDAIVKEQDLTAKELDQDKENGADDGTISAKIEILNSALTAEKKKRGELEALVQQLMREPEGDVPLAIINQFSGPGMKHSATHLFGSGHSYDAFDKRPWNQRLRDGGIKATDFNNDSTIPTLQGDIDHFVRQNPSVINSLFSDYEDLPAEWDRRSGVLDQVSDGYMIAGEIVQARKGGWQPKNKFKFDSEIGRVYPKKIDITFNGYQLQKIENTWVAQTQNMSGSHPWKMSFIGFLLFELTKQQKVDDRIAQINGIYAVNPDETVAGDNINSQNGLRWLWYYYRDVKKKYRPFSMGVPTVPGIVDYIRKMIELIPEDERKNQGFEIQISDKWWKAYKKTAGDLYQHHYNTDQGKMEYKENHPIDYPNFKFQVLKDMTNTDFIGITYSKNVQVMEYDSSEKGKFTVTHEKRDTHIFADYKIGIRFLFVGMKTTPADGFNFEKQQLWSNDVPVFSSDVTAPVFDDETGILKLNYTSVKVDKKWVTDIAAIEGDFEAGQIIRITGNPQLAGVKNLVDGEKIQLVGNASYALNTPGTITLFVNDDKTFTELGRTTTAPAVVANYVGFEGDSIDADEGVEFRFEGDVTTAFDAILKGAENKSIKIYGTDAVGVDLTFESDSTDYKVNSDAILGTSGHYIRFTKVNGLWTETKRVTA